MYTGHRTNTIALATLLLISLNCAGAQERAIPADLQAFAQKAETALAAKNNEAVIAMANTPDALKWLGHAARPGQTNWKLAILPLPTINRQTSVLNHQFLAVFYDYHTCESIGDHVLGLVKTDGDWRFSTEIPETETLGYRVRDHKLDVKCELAKSACSITDEVDVERTTAQPNALCLLRLSSVMTVDAASLLDVDGHNPNGKPLNYTHVPGVMAFSAPGRRIRISIAYHGAFMEPRMDSYVHPTETVMNSYWYPHIGRLPAKHTVTITVLKGWIGEGEGELKRREEKRHTTVYTFRNEIPTCYFSLDSGPYTVTSRIVDGRRLSVYALKATAEQSNRALDTLQKALAFFEKSFGPFPYTHYEMVETLGPFGGALEAYSFATFQRGTFGANVHELSHTWWGGIVPCTYTHSMWNESFANYSDGLFRRQTSTQPPATALRGMHAGSDQGRNMIRGYSIPVAEAFDTGNGAHNASGYGKGSQVMAMLEDLIGTETIIRCMRRFREDLVPGNAAEWPDFERAVKEVTGQDYEWFFDQWLHRPGVPVLRLTNVLQENGRLTADVIQEGEPYRLRLPISITDSSGAVKKIFVESTGAMTKLNVTLASAAKSIAVDPDGTLLLAGAQAADGSDPLLWRAK